MVASLRSILNDYLNDYGNKTTKITEENNCDDNVELEDDGDIFVDKNINIKMKEVNIGNKNYITSYRYLDVPQLKQFANGSNILLMHFQRKNNDKIMTVDEIRQYVDIKKNGIFFKRSIKPEMLYKIAKSLNTDFYLAINNKDNVVPISKWCAEQIFKNNCKINLNKKKHITSFEINDQASISNDDKFKIALHNWFGQHVRHKHPYAYSDMVINKQVKNYTFSQKGTNGIEVITHAQFSNELTNKYLTENTFHELKSFVNKLSRALNEAQKEHKNENGEVYYKKYVFAMPFPLYDREHMLSIVAVIHPTGKVNITIINANRRPTAEQDYAIPIMKILQKAFNEYAPHTLAKNTTYFFQEHKSQYGPTCMTHADVITRQIVKDENLEKDCQDINPIKILEKAYIRGFAVTLYQQALKQRMFIPDMTDALEKLQQSTEKLLNIDHVNSNKNYSAKMYSKHLYNKRPKTSFRSYFNARQSRNNDKKFFFFKKKRKLNNQRFLKTRNIYNSLHR